MTTMVGNLGATASDYVTETRRLHGIDTATEETFYPAVRDLLTSILRSQNLLFEVRTGTSESNGSGRNAGC